MDDLAGWNKVLAGLAREAGADIAIALELGKVPRRLGASGLLPADVSLAVDEKTLLEALDRIGIGHIWARPFQQVSQPEIIVVAASRMPFTAAALSRLEEATPDLELRAALSASQSTVANERALRATIEARLAEIERQRTVGAVAARIAHDLSAPISALLMEVSELRERITYLTGVVPEANPTMRNVIEDIRGLSDHITDSSERARGMLIEFRLIAHGGGASSSMASTAINVAESVRRCVKQLTPLARGKAQIELTIEPGLPIIAGSASKLESAFQNLINNAIQAASVREGFAGLVETRVRRAGGDIVVEIQDNGAGIKPEHMAHIFEPFFTTKGPLEGTGLGLPMARQAIESHGGVIEAESTRGRGATFRVRLPVTPVPARAAPTQARQRVLIVDDDDRVARALERILRNDYDVTLARGGEHALELIATVGPFDVMLVDLSMPGMDGPELFERIRHRWPGMERKIVIATGGAFSTASREFLAKVPNSRFEKPISLEELRPIVESVLGR